MNIVTINDESIDIFMELIPENMRNFYKQNNYFLFGLEDDNNAVGCIICEIDDIDTLRIIWIYVDKEHRKKGYGRFMYESMLDIMKKCGYKRLISIFEQIDKYLDYFLFIDSMSNTSIRLLTNDLITLNAIDILNKLEQSGVNDNKVVSIDKITNIQLRTFLSKVDEKMPLEDNIIDVQKHGLSSCAITEGRELIALLQCAKVDDNNYAITSFYNKSTTAMPLLSMLLYATKQIVNENSEANITVATFNDLGKTISKICADDVIIASVLGSETYVH